MKRFSWEFRFAIYLIALSAVLYLIHFAWYRDIHHIVFWSLTDLAFLPISVLFVTLVINRLLVMREKRAMLEKLNMVIGAFFSEVGTYLLTYFSDFDPGLDNIKKKLVVTKDWSEREFLEVGKSLRSHDYEIDIKRVNLEDLRSFLVGKRNFLLRLLENPNLLEHESFTELLRAAFHLTEELEKRKDFKKLPGSDIEHLAGDMKRAYILVAKEWLDYMKYLKNNYPYLFSLAMRTNPFDETASPIVK
jgi:hypothetical protein